MLVQWTEWGYAWVVGVMGYRMVVRALTHMVRKKVGGMCLCMVAVVGGMCLCLLGRSVEGGMC